MIQSVAWLGRYVQTHEIGEYTIVEYKGKVYENSTPKVPTQYEEDSSFAPFINGRRICSSYETLDEAIVGAIAVKYDGGNTRADTYFMKAIKP